MRPRYEIADIIRRHSPAFLKQYPQSGRVMSTLQALALCRTRYMGGHAMRCTACGRVTYRYNSCRNRHCPKCQAVDRERWMMQREAELLPVAYYHMVFTLPHALHPLVRQQPRRVYNALFHAAWHTIQAFAADSKYLGAKMGMTAILHTWGQQLWLHPHLHCIVPGGGITRKGQWQTLKKGNGKYLFPKKAMSPVFRAKFMARLRASGVEVPQDIAKQLFEKDWVVYAKRPFASPKTVVEYLGRYTHKIAISNHRLQQVDDNFVTFSYKDYTQGGKKKSMQLPPVEFLRRFCLHILPSGFVRMRHYGILASRNKHTELNLAKKAHSMAPWQKVEAAWIEIAEKKLGISPNQCPVCQGTLEIIHVLPAQRGPPINQKPPAYAY